MTKHFQTFIRLLLPLIFITYVGGQTWFSHVHRVEQGVIVHVHPYKQKHHTHTPKQFETILFLSHYLLPELTVLEQLLPLPVFHWYVCHYQAMDVAVVKTWLRHLAARASPCQ